MTGAASPIGFGIAARLAAEGASLVLGDIDAGRLEEAEQKIRPEATGTIHALAGDLSRREDAEALVAAAAGRTGGFEVLVNCAGGGVILPTPDHTEETLRATIDRNLWTTLYCTLAALPVMAAAGYGRIVNVGAESVRNGLYRHAVYNAAKGGVHAFATGLAREYAEQGITVNTVAPAWISTAEAEARLTAAPEEVRTDMAGFFEQITATIPMRRPGTVAEVSAAVAFLASREASFITGQTLSVNGGSSML
ncbi:2,3-dihydroxy-2,3-dihydro-p-cumate dehydrogenase [Streptomyces albus]|uniref:2,3-dihydroxy-2,3-dihydro-p-cumate dehydrogenase n=1 Tax=Streptomyces albus (strain ATCC 21838 / DSM 41398 / FERM P-419 / JCM 4703 / NBRC 107858) TaxID=1081613 RepID=A0A0B5F6S9_STRA4|nr:2,3-dihydroxy-2,3-dihydro-p-cumate dehydrogenase [Streptomyces albus]AOU81583.1 2,3-dihydroxy-2,3-dihydro-p-cumate dehydrogenase [Streptomyces albus]AYN37275.1 2,3-dihydroxy-2,3-dihydro-p-cumate dehydrogenase [Streptomyces albus]